MVKPLQATKNATTLARKIAQSWSFIPLVLIVSELSLKIANSELKSYLEDKSWTKRAAKPISFPELRSPWPAVGKRELWEHPFSNSNWNNRILHIRFHCAVRNLYLWYLWHMPEMDAPRALVFRPLVKGNEALGTRLRRNMFRFLLRPCTVKFSNDWQISLLGRSWKPEKRRDQRYM